MDPIFFSDGQRRLCQDSADVLAELNKLGAYVTRYFISFCNLFWWIFMLHLLAPWFILLKKKVPDRGLCVCSYVLQYFQENICSKNVPHA